MTKETLYNICYSLHDYEGLVCFFYCVASDIRFNRSVPIDDAYMCGGVMK